jgi:hypothetical protein
MEILKALSLPRLAYPRGVLLFSTIRERCEDFVLEVRNSVIEVVDSWAVQTVPSTNQCQRRLKWHEKINIWRTWAHSLGEDRRLKLF